jgi:hypothetical protein
MLPPPYESQWLFAFEIVVRIFLAGFFLMMMPFSAFLADSGTPEAKTVASFMFFACFGLAVGMITRFLPLLGVSGSVFLTYVVLAIIYTAFEIPNNARGNRILVASLWLTLMLSVWYFCHPFIYSQQGEGVQQERYSGDTLHTALNSIPSPPA